MAFTLVYTYPRTFYFSGQIETTYPDGRSQVQYASGASKTKYMDGREEAHWPDGTKLWTDGKGHGVMTFPSGMREIYTPICKVISIVCSPECSQYKTSGHCEISRPRNEIVIGYLS